jgi:hypothetical protein
MSVMTGGYSKSQIYCFHEATKFWEIGVDKPNVIFHYYSLVWLIPVLPHRDVECHLV